MRARLPWLALALALAAATFAIGSSPTLSAALQLDRAAVAQGEWWRLLTCHFTHWTNSHLAWDLAAFLALGGILERISVRRFIATAVASAIGVSLAVLFFVPECGNYRGLSGIDSALFAAAVVELFRQARAAKSRLAIPLPALALAAFVGKSLIELVDERSLFVAASAAFVPLPLAHLSGAVCGLVCALAARTTAQIPKRFSASPLTRHTRQSGSTFAPSDS